MAGEPTVIHSVVVLKTNLITDMLGADLSQFPYDVTEGFLKPTKESFLIDGTPTPNMAVTVSRHNLKITNFVHQQINNVGNQATQTYLTSFTISGSFFSEPTQQNIIFNNVTPSFIQYSTVISNTHLDGANNLHSLVGLYQSKPTNSRLYTIHIPSAHIKLSILFSVAGGPISLQTAGEEGKLNENSEKTSIAKCFLPFLY